MFSLRASLTHIISSKVNSLEKSPGTRQKGSDNLPPMGLKDLTRLTKQNNSTSSKATFLPFLHLHHHPSQKHHGTFNFVKTNIHLVAIQSSVPSPKYFLAVSALQTISSLRNHHLFAWMETSFHHIYVYVFRATPMGYGSSQARY